MVVKRLDRQAVNRFLLIAKPFFVSELRWRALGLLALLVSLALLISGGVNVILSYVGRDFFTALTLREKEEFAKQLLRYLGAFAVATPIVVFYRYTEERLALLWRRWLSINLVGKYLSNKSYYELTWDNSIDNPDQRIEADIRTFCSTTLSFFLIILNSCIAIFFFVGILWSISHWLTIAVFGYAFLGSVATYLLGKPLISLNFAQLKKDADYRYKLINVRDNAEAIAFYGVEDREVTRIRQRLGAALENLLSIINWNRNLNFFTTGYNYLIAILPTVIVAPLYFDKKIEFGVVTQANFAFGQVLGALSIIVLNFQSISSYVAVIKRLGSFFESIDNIKDSSKDTGRIALGSAENRIEFSNVTIRAPNNQSALIEELSFCLERGSLLITGPSGSGKSSILRALAGLWHSGAGEILSPPRSRCFFVPQRSYMGLGTFRSQLLYGLRRRGLIDKEIQSVIRKVELDDLVQRIGGLDALLDWPSVLAAGEQQKVAFARLFLGKPEYVFLDEATTALEPDNERRLYEQLKDSVRIIVSVGHRAMLSKYHTHVLELLGNGKWRLEKNISGEGQ